MMPPPTKANDGTSGRTKNVTTIGLTHTTTGVTPIEKTDGTTDGTAADTTNGTVIEATDVTAIETNDVRNDHRNDHRNERRKDHRNDRCKPWR